MSVHDEEEQGFVVVLSESQKMFDMKRIVFAIRNADTMTGRARSNASSAELELFASSAEMRYYRTQENLPRTIIKRRGYLKLFFLDPKWEVELGQANIIVKLARNAAHTMGQKTSQDFKYALDDIDMHPELQSIRYRLAARVFVCQLLISEYRLVNCMRNIANICVCMCVCVLCDCRIPIWL